MKKHEAFETDFNVHRDRATEIQREGDRHCAEGNHNQDAIRNRCAALQKHMDELEQAAGKRKGRLHDNSAFLQFIWKTDVVESWIGESSVTSAFLAMM